MADNWKRACELLRKIWPEDKVEFLKAQADKAVVEFTAILTSDISLFLGKNAERGAEYEADGVVGAYFAIREIFVRLHHLVFDNFRKGRELDWDSEEGKELQNLLQDIRVTSMLGQIGLNHRNWCGNPEYLEAVLNLQLGEKKGCGTCHNIGCKQAGAFNKPCRECKYGEGKLDLWEKRRDR